MNEAAEWIASDALHARAAQVALTAWCAVLDRRLPRTPGERVLTAVRMSHDLLGYALADHLREHEDEEP